MSFGNAFIILGVVMTMTILLILLYKFRFYRVCFTVDFNVKEY